MKAVKDTRNGTVEGVWELLILEIDMEKKEVVEEGGEDGAPKKTRSVTERINLLAPPTAPSSTKTAAAPTATATATVGSTKEKVEEKEKEGKK